MSALRVLASPKVWLSVVGVAVVLALVFFAYLAAVASPEENLKKLPVALVNEDKGAELGGKKVNLGNQVVEKATSPDSPAAGTVDWERPETRKEALRGIGRNDYYGAVVIPVGYSERISNMAGPPNVPIAVVNEDEGAEMNGRPASLGAEVVKRIISPDSPAPDFVRWTQTDDREAALEGLSEGKFYAAVVVPKDYSRRLAGVSGPPPGVSSGPSTDSPPEPARMELLTSPAVRPSITSLIQNAFSGIVVGVSEATSGRILGGLSEQGSPVPPGTSAVISDPVRGEVVEAEVSGKAGPLPKAPQPAEIEVLTNQSAGQGAATPVRSISTGIVQSISRATSDRLSVAAGERGAQFPPEVAAVVGDPVRAEFTDAQPVGPNSGNGQSPFFLAFLANLSGLLGAAVVFFGTAGAADRLASRGLRTSHSGLWTVRILVGLVYAALVAGTELWVAFEVVGVEHEASTSETFVFLTFAVAAVLTATLFLTTSLGPAGLGIGAILFVILGMVSSGGLAPLEALPPFYRIYADWLPLRYVIDGLRSLLFYDGRPDAAGFEDAIRFLGVCLVGSAVSGYALSFIRDLTSSSRKGTSPSDGERSSVAMETSG